MVRQKKVKAARRAANRSQSELQSKLREQYALLKVQADAYDRGDHIIALSGATTLRVLLHNTNASHALLEQLGYFQRCATWIPLSTSCRAISCPIQDWSPGLVHPCSLSTSVVLTWGIMCAPNLGEFFANLPLERYPG